MLHGQDLDVRLIGIDTPETVDPSQPVQCFAEQASRFTDRSLTGQAVRLEFDMNGTTGTGARSRTSGSAGICSIG
ncbi:MAG: thermonuclease family protein, partial [Actinomycetota bacterium]